jgi:hypothetical protein
VLPCAETVEVLLHSWYSTLTIDTSTESNEFGEMRIALLEPRRRSMREIQGEELMEVQLNTPVSLRGRLTWRELYSFL